MKQKKTTNKLKRNVLITAAIILSVIAILQGVFWYAAGTQRKLTREFEKITFGSEYSLTGHNCFNVELEDICGYTYTTNNVNAWEGDVISTLKASGYSIYPYKDSYIAISSESGIWLEFSELPVANSGDKDGVPIKFRFNVHHYSENFNPLEMYEIDKGAQL